jgi:DNA repair protein RadC
MGGTAKRAQLVAVLELARRAVGQQLKKREVFSSPGAVKQYLQLHWPPGLMRSSPCCSWMRRNG